MDELPKELKIKIITFLNVKHRDILLLNLVSKNFHLLLWKKISLYEYPYLKNESFYQITADYHVYKNYIKKMNYIANEMYEKDNIEMLLENQWL